MIFWIFGFFAIPAVLLLGGYLMANHPTQRSNALCATGPSALCKAKRLGILPRTTVGIFG